MNAAERGHIYDLLSVIPDPEIPVINIRELGILRDIRMEGETLVVVITPTYSGCPAMKVIEDDIRKVLGSEGFRDVKVELVYSPAWTTDWISEEAKTKLREYGIVPPEHSSVNKSLITGKIKNLRCPVCNSENVEMISQFGSTACKALYRCKDCKEPFDYFKCL